MTLKLTDLVNFAKHAKNQTYPNTEIHISKLKLMIAEQFGISDYIQKNIISKLVEFGLMNNKTLNLFEIREAKATNEIVAELEKKYGKEGKHENK